MSQGGEHMKPLHKQCPKCQKTFTSPHVICPDCGALLNVIATPAAKAPDTHSRIKPGIYGRAFEWNIARADKEAISNIAQAFVALSAAEHLDIFEDYLDISRRRRSNLLALVKLQLHLIDDLIVIQSAIKHYRKKWDELTSKLKPNGADEQSKTDLKLVERELFFNRAYANCIRGIGDGIAWRALGYDRVALRVLSGSAVKQQILDEGAINELRIWAAAADTGKGLPIFNAATNWLALGDVTIVRHDGTVEIVEAKTSGANSPRVTRQKERMREATAILQNGKGRLEGEEVNVMRLNVPLNNNLSGLRQLLETANKTGWASGFVGNSCYAQVFDPRVESARSALENGIAESKTAIEAWRAKDDFVMRLDSSGIVSFTPNCAPVAVYPFSARLCVELLTGAKTYTCLVNLTEIGREFERYGWMVSKSTEEFAREAKGQAASAFFRLEKAGFHAEIPPADIMRIVMETMDPKYIVDTLEALRGLGPVSSSTMSIFAFETDKTIWD
jgi:hypothetical protein